MFPSDKKQKTKTIELPAYGSFTAHDTPTKPLDDSCWGGINGNRNRSAIGPITTER
jgi:hypothetical protein